MDRRAGPPDAATTASDGDHDPDRVGDRASSRASFRGSHLRRGLAAGAGLLAAGLTLALLLGVARTAWQAIQAPGPAAPSDGLLLAVGLAGTALLLWFAAAVLLAALATLPGRVGAACRVLADRLAPAVARRVVAVVLGSTLSAAAVPGPGATAADTDTPTAAGAQRPVATAVPDPGLRSTPVGEPRPDLVATGSRLAAVAPPGASGRSGAGAHAATSSPEPRSQHQPHQHQHQHQHQPQTQPRPGPQPEPVWTPTRPAPPLRSTDAGLGALRSAGIRHVDEHVVVRRGDTLWSVAGRHLGADATAAQIAAEWPRWYAANRSVIGHDPDVLLPGQRLLPPDAHKVTR